MWWWDWRIDLRGDCLKAVFILASDGEDVRGPVAKREFESRKLGTHARGLLGLKGLSWLDRQTGWESKQWAFLNMQKLQPDPPVQRVFCPLVGRLLLAGADGLLLRIDDCP